LSSTSAFGWCMFSMVSIFLVLIHSICRSMEWINMNYHFYTGILTLKNPYKQRYIAGSRKPSTKPLSLLPHQNIYSFKGKSSHVLCHYTCQKWHKSDMDSQHFFLKTSSKLKRTKSDKKYQNVQLSNLVHHHST
jgi:hypothetical protein